LDYDGVKELAKNFPSKRANHFVEWFTDSDETADGKSKSKAYVLFDGFLLDTIEYFGGSCTPAGVRPVRRCGAGWISLAAASDQRRRLWKPQFFEKN
jgi:hypothetical protein